MSLAVLDAAFGAIASGPSSPGDPESIVVNVDSIYREIDPEHESAAAPELFTRMQKYRARR